MASPATRQQQPAYSSAAFPPLSAGGASSLSPDAFPALSSASALGHSAASRSPAASGLPPASVTPAAQADLAYQQHALLLAREQHRANLLGSVNNAPPSSPSVAALLNALNGKQIPPDAAVSAAAAAAAAAAGKVPTGVTAMPPGIAPSMSQMNGAPPRQSVGATVDVGEAQAAINAVQSALDAQSARGPGPMAQGSISPRAVEAAQNALDAATAAQGSDHKVVLSGPGASTLLSLVSQTSARPSSAAPALPLPQAATPAQQIYLSPADRFGLLGLLAIIKSQGDASLVSMGTDLRRMGMNLNSRDTLSASFLTPWADDAASGPDMAVAQAQLQTQAMVEPDFHLPSCYNVQPPPPAQTKIHNLADETLFFIFYSAPRDVLQETAARELYQRGWRYHKTLRVWLTKDPTTEPIQKTTQYERGAYVFFDPGSWEKVTKLFTLYYEALEERSLPGAALAPASAPVPVPGSTGSVPQHANAPANAPAHVHAHAHGHIHAQAPSPITGTSSAAPAPSQFAPAQPPLGAGSTSGLMGYNPASLSAQQQYGLAHAQAVQAHALAQQRRAAAPQSQTS